MLVSWLEVKSEPMGVWNVVWKNCQHPADPHQHHLNPTVRLGVAFLLAGADDSASGR